MNILVKDIFDVSVEATEEVGLKPDHENQKNLSERDGDLLCQGRKSLGTIMRTLCLEVH